MGIWCQNRGHPQLAPDPVVPAWESGARTRPLAPLVADVLPGLVHDQAVAGALEGGVAGLVAAVAVPERAQPPLGVLGDGGDEGLGLRGTGLLQRLLDGGRRRQAVQRYPRGWRQLHLA